MNVLKNTIGQEFYSLDAAPNLALSSLDAKTSPSSTNAINKPAPDVSDQAPLESITSASITQSSSETHTEMLEPELSPEIEITQPIKLELPEITSPVGGGGFGGGGGSMPSTKSDTSKKVNLWYKNPYILIPSAIGLAIAGKLLFFKKK